MCVLAMAWRAHPRWRLIVVGNRDELHTRPARALARWPEDDGLLAGRDLLSGGTWLGVSEEGRFAVITNLRGFGAPDPNAPSRGLLLKDMLLGHGRYVDPTDAETTTFSPFNLIRVQGGEAVFATNRPSPLRRHLSSGIYGLSNGMLDEPWPKTTQLKTILADWLARDVGRPEALLDGLQKDRLDASAAFAVPASDATSEPTASSIFIRDPIYGTRCGTVVAIDEQGQGIIIERRFGATGIMTGETALPFAWPD